jgi:hypothetical protein
MARRLLLLASVVSGLFGAYGFPLVKRSNHAYLFGGKQPLQGLEVDGLFNPMQRFLSLAAKLIRSINPRLFERASEEHGSKLTTYLDICLSL